MSSLDVLLDLLKMREIILFNELSATLGSSKNQYQIMFHEASDLIQAYSTAFGERLVLENSIKRSMAVSTETRAVLQKIIQVFGLDVVEKDLGFFVKEDLIVPDKAKQVSKLRSSLVKEVAAKSNDIIECLNVPIHALQAPIAGDYVYFETRMPKL